MTTKSHPTSFSALLRQHMEEQQMSVHALARRMAGGDASWEGYQAKEAYRRKINWWLHRGVIPNERSRQELEHALGLTDGALLEDDPELALIGVLMEQIEAAKARRNARKVPA